MDGPQIAEHWNLDLMLELAGSQPYCGWQSQKPE
jgi:hypothetical protein